MYNLLIGGAAGQGVDTTGAILERLLKHAGYCVFSTKDVMSRVRGGHNFTLIRFSSEAVHAHDWGFDLMIALNDETIETHLANLRPGGFIIGDEALKTKHPQLLKLDMLKKAKEIGNPRVASSVAVGSFLKLFKIPTDAARTIFERELKPQYVDMNMEAVQYGYDLVDAKFEAETGDWQDALILNANQAISLGAIAAGLKFYTAYPMSPSTSIMEYLAETAAESAVLVEQAEDEIAAINAAVAASFAGARAMTATSGGGLALMSEAMGMAGLGEVPVVAVDTMRVGPVTGLPTRTEQSDLKFAVNISAGEFPRAVLSVRSHEDAFYQTMRAFDIAERYQLPVVLLSDQYLSDGSAAIRMPDPKRYPVAAVGASELEVEAAISTEGRYKRYQVTESGISPRLIPGSKLGFTALDTDEHTEDGLITESGEVRNAQVEKRERKMKRLAAEVQEPWLVGDEDANIFLIAWGSLYGPVEETVRLSRAAGVKIGALIFGDIWPLPMKELNRLLPEAKIVVNVEQNSTGQLAGLIREETGYNMTDSILKYDGRQISADEIVNRLADILNEVAEEGTHNG